MHPPSIKITTASGHDIQAFLSSKNYSKISVLVDENTVVHCYPLLYDFLPPHNLIQVNSGEEFKTLETCTSIWQQMTEALLDRHSVLIIMGGGVLGDMGGFCAATYKRGIDFILIPTTLLAQADSSIGGKVGVDFNDFKNHIGVFRESTLNLIHSGFLNTLPEQELRSGFAEVIKHALISDAALWNEIRVNNLHEQPWEKLISKSVEFKSSVVQHDPHEKGLRKILNAGHTVGHALESYFLAKGKKILHGEAIAAGLIAEGFLAVKRKLLSEADLQQIERYILEVFGKLQFSAEEIPEISGLTLQDKKNKGNRILVVLPEGIGKAKWDVSVSLDEIGDCLAYYKSLQI
jgi:3-dehydroquinate synthase